MIAQPITITGLSGGQFENVPTIPYNQDKWVESAHYHHMYKELVIKLWTVYNEFLCRLIKLIPEKKLLAEANTGGDNNYTIGFLINDYLFHLEHH